MKVWKREHDNELYDVLIVGSGATGGYLARSLAAAGMRVLVLEAGPSKTIARVRDFTFKVKRKLGYRIEEDLNAVARQHVQSQNYAWSGHPHVFVDDVDHAYETAPDKPFLWVRARQVGGRMEVRQHGRQFYRMSGDDFHAGSFDGGSQDWPLSYEELEPYYEHVERWLKIAGNRDGVASLPDSVYYESQPWTADQQRFASELESGTSGGRLVARRTTFHARFELASSHDGKLELRTDSVVTHVDFDPVTRRAHGVTYIDAKSSRTRQARAKLVVLCASAIETTRLLLHSATHEYPDGLGNASDVLGRYLMDHVRLGPIIGRRSAALPRHEQPMFMYAPQYMNRFTSTKDFVRGYALQIWAFGDECHVVPLGEMLPRAENRVQLHPDRKDRWGIPIAHIDCGYGENEHALMRHAYTETEAMLHRAGYSIVESPALSPPGFALHEGGTARMGDNPKTSFVNRDCQSWEISNLYVADASIWVSHGVQNITLTMLALAARTADAIIARFKRGEVG